ncbi:MULTISPECIES: SDR family NAD(P)-dependent oxidoreductase [unclassified Crossiella]|uniref:SDR family NAD(P)-dependent oxidoreductase n=1 Tax=unclassified Crossiella TaxID=2620835 RepID=UPI001FFF9BFC|nr:MULTISPECIES: SDR family NAD(P)-dependent oxidoreductase [unclassified Crossiella]MCK2242021.1 SDR family oxidoreductase [Crossiella sp. S99.2]MCK2255924.1 SDR family oxidoreductase [Crossiella sp. S99.1]
MARTSLVTGAGRGIGAAVARRLSGEGHRVALTARSEAELRAVAATLPGESLVLPADLTEPGAVAGLFDAVEAAWSPVEILVANAGSGTATPLHRITDEEWSAALALNLTAPFQCLRRAIPAMRAAGWGRLIVIASTAAKQGEAHLAAYTAAKHGVLGLVRTAAAELARTGVTANAICPAYVDTPMTERTVDAVAERTGRPRAEIRAMLAGKQPIGRMISVEEVADAVSFCVASPAFTGQGLNIDGGTVQS